MKHPSLKYILALSILLYSSYIKAQNAFTDEIAMKLSKLPLHCIVSEYPNKTAHIINNKEEAKLTPSELHPAFYGCFDWHSSVHGHWMLVRLLKTKPYLPNRKEIIETLNRTLTAENLLVEAKYFGQYALADSYERTYGWAWLLKLDEELATWKDPQACEWHKNMQPVTKAIVERWKKYLPKETYPNRTGVHPNTAFALAYAIDWARTTGDSAFEKQLKEKAFAHFLKDEKIPAYLEPNGSDFFSPSLETADLMCRIMSKQEFTRWFNKFFDKRDIENISKAAVISDIKDYQIVHLVGLSFSKSWCMKHIGNALPENHPYKKHFLATSKQLLENALPFVFQGNYGGEHWLASFAVMAMQEN